MLTKQINSADPTVFEKQEDREERIDKIIIQEQKMFN